MTSRTRGIFSLLVALTFLAACGQNQPAAITTQTDNTIQISETAADPQSSENSTETMAEPITGETISDIDGNLYPILQVGDQWWMGANLNTTSDPNGDPIEGYCYNNDEANCVIYGRLYRWETAMNGSTAESAQGICPAGWHIPSDEEWLQLINSIGNESDAGGKIKQVGTAYWFSPNTGATDLIGFNALPTGWFDFTGEFFGVGDGCFFRTSSAESPWEVYARILSSERSSFSRGGVHPDDALPIRCVRD